MKMKKFIKEIDIIKENLHSKQTQSDLRKFVLNKSNPLEERFRVWSEHCDKKEEPWVIHKGEYGIIGNMVDDCWPYDYNKYVAYDFNDFLDFVAEYHKDKDEYHKPEGFEIPSVDEFKEMLIATNFGSFTMDW
jgi:hypothetical protein